MLENTRTPDAFPLSLKLPTKPNDRKQWSQLRGSSQALAIYSASQQAPGPVLVLTATTSDAQALEAELRFFSGQKEPSVMADSATSHPEILHFPDWETLPYDSFSPHQDIISQRIQTLYRLPKTQSGILIVALPTLMNRLAPQSFLTGHSLVLDVGELFEIETVRTQLNTAGYRCVDTVYEHGEFALRGSIMDIFPMGATSPIASNSLMMKSIPSEPSMQKHSARWSKSSRFGCYPVKSSLLPLTLLLTLNLNSKSASMSILESARSIKTFKAASPRQVLSTISRSSLSPLHRCLTTYQAALCSSPPTGRTVPPAVARHPTTVR